MSFIKKNNMVCIIKDINEPYELYIKRGFFVASIYPSVEPNYNVAVKYSKIYVNCDYLKMEYPPAIMDKLNNFKKYLFN